MREKQKNGQRKPSKLSKPTYKNMGIYYNKHCQTISIWEETNPVLFKVIREAYIEIHKEKDKRIEE